MLENSYRTQSENVSFWVSSFIENRYGYTDKNLTTAWQMLMKSVYNFTDKTNTDVNHGVYVLTTRPGMHLEQKIWYDPKDVLTAAQLYANSTISNPQLCRTESFEYDFIDILRQTIQLIVSNSYNETMSAFSMQNQTAFEESAGTIMNALQFLNKVLSCHEAFMIGPWLDMAIAAAEPNDQALFEYNARNQITLWGPDGQILDYAAKMWSGIVDDYYLLRWSLFIDTLRQALKSSTAVDEIKMQADMFEKIEKPFTLSRIRYPSKPVQNICELLKNQGDMFHQLLRM